MGDMLIWADMGQMDLVHRALSKKKSDIAACTDYIELLVLLIPLKIAVCLFVAQYPFHFFVNS